MSRPLGTRAGSGRRLRRRRWTGDRGRRPAGREATRGGWTGRGGRGHRTHRRTAGHRRRSGDHTGSDRAGTGERRELGALVSVLSLPLPDADLDLDAAADQRLGDQLQALLQGVLLQVGEELLVQAERAHVPEEDAEREPVLRNKDEVSEQPPGLVRAALHLQDRRDAVRSGAVDLGLGLDHRHLVPVDRKRLGGVVRHLPEGAPADVGSSVRCRHLLLSLVLSCLVAGLTVPGPTSRPVSYSPKIFASISVMFGRSTTLPSRPWTRSPASNCGWRPIHNFLTSTVFWLFSSGANSV